MRITESRRVFEMDVREIVEQVEKLLQEMRTVIDKGEIAKPNSGNLKNDVVEAVDRYITPYKPSLKVRPKALIDRSPLQGFSNRWKPDVVIEDTEIEDEVDRVKAIVECKEPTPGAKYETFRYTHVYRAYVEFTDLRNWGKPLKFAIFSRRLDKGRRGFDSDALLESIGARPVDWSENYEWFTHFVLSIFCLIQ